MARRQIVKTIPTSLEMYLACNYLALFPGCKESPGIYKVIGGFVMNKPVDQRLMIQLRKRWYCILRIGLTKEQINELVNT